MAAEERWYFTKEQLGNTPSRKCGFDADKELSSRQQAANFIQDMGQRLQVTQLCINTAIVYMHRFYMFHSFTRFHRNAMAAAALFLAAKVEEQPRKLEHVIKVAQICLHREQPPLDIKSEVYMEQAQELVVNENILLQTLGFDVAIDHPHTHVVRCCTLVRDSKSALTNVNSFLGFGLPTTTSLSTSSLGLRATCLGLSKLTASKDLAQTSYFMASNSLHLTTMCLQYKPTVVACFCIHLACKWSNWEIPQSNEGKPWFWYVDKTVSQELLEQLTEEFLVIFEKCPSRLKKKIMSLSSNQHSQLLTSFNNEKQAQQQQIQESKRNGEGSTSHHPQQHQHQSGMPYPNSVAGGSNNNITNEDMNMKRKLDYNQRHHSDYKKSAHVPSSHHSRSESMQPANMGVKSSCMFGPPQRTQSGQNSSLSSSLAGLVLPGTGSGVPGQGGPGRSGGGQQQQQGSAAHKTHTSGGGGGSGRRTTQPPPPAEPLLAAPLGNHQQQPHGFKKEHFYPTTQPPTVEVPKPSPLLATQLPIVKVERSIFSPEALPITPPPPAAVEPHKAEPLTRVKEEKKDERPLPPQPPQVVPVLPSQTKEEKIEIRQEPLDVSSPPVKQLSEPVAAPAATPLPSAALPVEETVKEAKKKKKKHKEHKEHKEKHKDKHKHKKEKQQQQEKQHKEPGPIVITIPKDRLTLPKEQPLKIKIPKDKIAPLPTTTPVKLKIPREKLKESRKRGRSDSPDSTTTSSSSKRSNGAALQVNKESFTFQEDDINDKILNPLSPLGNIVHDRCTDVPLGIAESPPPVLSDLAESPPTISRCIVESPPPMLSPPPPAPHRDSPTPNRSGSALSRSSPVLSRSSPALPRSSPALSRNSPALPRNSPALPRTSPAMPRSSPVPPPSSPPPAKPPENHRPPPTRHPPTPMGRPPYHQPHKNPYRYTSTNYSYHKNNNNNNNTPSLNKYQQGTRGPMSGRPYHPGQVRYPGGGGRGKTRAHRYPPPRSAGGYFHSAGGAPPGYRPPPASELSYHPPPQLSYQYFEHLPSSEYYELSSAGGGLMAPGYEFYAATNVLHAAPASSLRTPSLAYPTVGGPPPLPDEPPPVPPPPPPE